MSKKLLVWTGYELEVPDDFMFSTENIENVLYALNKGEYKNLPVRQVKLDKIGDNRKYSVTVEYN
jgi:hypothetical protein